MQDIEAEDKLLGPLSLRQFIYAIIVVVLGFVAFQLGRAAWFLALPFLPPMLFFGLLAAPFGQNQSSEIWLLAKIRFFLFPRKRIWDQTGIQELVHITAPKKVEEQLTKEFTAEEAKSRLKALASTLDTRGWAIKDISAENFQRTASLAPTTSDRLIDIGGLPQESSDLGIRPDDDVLDPNYNPVAQKMNTMIETSAQTHRQELLERVHKLASEQKINVSPASSATKFDSAAIAPEPAILKRTDALPATPIVPISQPAQEPTIKTEQKSPKPPMTTKASTDILEPVKDNGNASVKISHQPGDTESDNDEVVVSLH